jgi:uncharacterized protein YfaT (DUF1175 family)
MAGLLTLVAGLAMAATSPHLNSSSDRKAFRRWFTFLAESRYYAHKPLRDASDPEGLLRWAYHQALRPHDARWYHTVELPLLPAMPSVRQNEAGICESHRDPLLRRCWFRAILPMPSQAIFSSTAVPICLRT